MKGSTPEPRFRAHNRNPSQSPRSSMKLIIVRLGLSSKSHPQKVGDFRFSAEHDSYILDGEALRPAAFNEITSSRRWKQLMEDHGSLITVRAVNIKDMAKARAKSPIGHAKPKKPVLT